MPFSAPTPIQPLLLFYHPFAKKHPSKYRGKTTSRPSEHIVRRPHAYDLWFRSGFPVRLYSHSSTSSLNRPSATKPGGRGDRITPRATSRLPHLGVLYRATGERPRVPT
ncbi:hypothetical protein BDM02DRAFT_3113896 [Thelephora ganbajun]|uniref:Uncharacterized protein n=1 Tax=Thelephora ganbajun TaxID=370292 RepID=A0ACB6ZIC9_THEGA|nr:hypothetical protein BDM02DRAFT_3113896 [Thelephora ganbajun]